MPAGRKRLPTKFHVLNGTDRPCRRNEDEPQPDTADKIPKPPKFLSGTAKKEWKSISKVLYRNGLLTEIDHSALALYCQAWGEFVDASLEIYGDKKRNITGKGFIITKDNGDKILNPLVGNAHRAMELSHKFLVEFGMTPSSRTKTKVNNSPKKTNKFANNMNRQAAG